MLLLDVGRVREADENRHMAVLDHLSGRRLVEEQSRLPMRNAIQAIVAGLTPRGDKDESSSAQPDQGKKRGRTK